MRRRDFFIRTAGASLGLGAVVSVGGLRPLMAGPVAGAADMAAVRGGEPDVMFDRAIAAMGGMGIVG